MKICAMCEKEKPLAEFNKKGSSVQPYCRLCDNKKSRERYKANAASHKQKVLERNKINKDKLKKEMREYKEKNPCADCGNFFPWYVMDFDHVRGEKIGNISTMIANLSTKKLKEELDKCELVCSNCHRVRTFTRQSPMV